MLTKTRGIVLRVAPYNDKSSIIYMYTEAFGRCSYMMTWPRGKGGKIPRSLFMPLSLLEIEDTHFPNRDLHRLTEARACYPMGCVALDPVRNVLALFLAEVIYRVVRDREPDQRLFDYLMESIGLLESLDQGIANFHIVFLLGLPRYLGIFPNLNAYRPGVFFDLREGNFTDRLPAHRDYLGARESEILYSLLRIRYENMALYAFSRQERVLILQRIIDYYRLHLPEFPEIKSLAVFQALFD